VVLAPYDVADCFHIGVEAFNIAETYQTPVIVLSDQYVGQRKESVPPFDIHAWQVESRRTFAAENGDGSDTYRRYKLLEGDVSPMALPGQPGGMHTVSGLEHYEGGDPTSSATMHERMTSKRYGKLERLARERGDQLVRFFGHEEPTIGVVCWGSTSAQAREAARRLNREGLKVGVCVPQLLVPFAAAQIGAFVRRVERTLWVELNHQAQFTHYALARLDVPRDRLAIHARAGGKPFTVAEIEARIHALAKGA
jgi:2-oxoglutarate ferredoxin oxidoreductase subunit alpha